MKHNRQIHRLIVFCTPFVLFLSGHLFSPRSVLADYALLKSIIVTYNMEALKESLIDGTHRGEEGILGIGPETGKALGMKVLIDQEYLDSSELFKKADLFLEKAKEAMASQEKEHFQGEHVQKIADYFLISKRSAESAKEKLGAYRSRLSADVDDRLNEAISAKVLDTLLGRSLKRNGRRLRDALGWLYNLCKGDDGNNHTLTPENVPFVNYVFYHFTRKAPAEALSTFDLDRNDGKRLEGPSYRWESAVGKEAALFIPLLKTAIKKLGNRIYGLDPLLFLALMRRESNFDPLAVSPVGAAGLTQIMPKTGKGLGMKNIYMPAYLAKAGALMESERKAKAGAMTALFEIDEKNKLQYAGLARKLMQRSLALGKQRERLFAQYKKELLKGRTDDRLQPSKAIEYGLKYFAGLMRDQRGDMSLALAAYNAGPYPVRKYGGIPPFEETVFFRNRTLEFYRDYLGRIKGKP